MKGEGEDQALRFDGEDEHVAAADLGRAAAVAVGRVRGDVELPLVALHHELHGLGPPLVRVRARVRARVRVRVRVRGRASVQPWHKRGTGEPGAGP